MPFTAHQYTRSDILRVADSSCYVAKEAGRNRVHVYDDADTAVATRNDELDWFSRLQKALTEDRFVLYAQRIASIQENGGGYESVEVLIRLLDDEGKIVAPMAFIPAAERYGLMPSIDRWVISKALAMHAAFAKNYKLPARFSINLSGAWPMPRWSTSFGKNSRRTVCRPSWCASRSPRPRPSATSTSRCS